MDSGSDIRLKTPDEIKRIQESCLVIKDIFAKLSIYNLENQSTLEIDKYVESVISRHKAKPSFKLVNDYYHATCISLNSEVVHGVPSKHKIIRKGDLVKIDVGVVKKGYFGDACRTFFVPEIEDDALRLIETTRRALEIGVKNCFDGNRLGTLGWAIQKYVEAEGFSIVREFTGHGVGFAVHESPVIFHYGEKDRGQRLRQGMVLAVEPIVNAGLPDVEILEDGWTAETIDGRLSAQFEDTIAITENGPVVLT
ncbi:MAG: type I methionyl aminopeptidase [Spirochaetes bacterium]|nr:type I methionyl aminopeptidase [Spirochaetota bacterium]